MGEYLDAETIAYLRHLEWWCARCQHPVGVLVWASHMTWHSQQADVAYRAVLVAEAAATVTSIETYLRHAS